MAVACAVVAPTVVNSPGIIRDNSTLPNSTARPTGNSLANPPVPTALASPVRAPKAGAKEEIADRATFAELPMVLKAREKKA